jgi:uncharacterized protein YjbI with pentapeptide repeats
MNEKEKKKLDQITVDIRLDLHRDWLQQSYDQADFSGEDLRGLDFRYKDLTSVIFRNANLEGVDFEGSYTFGADFEGANLKGTILEGWKKEEEK